METYISNTKVPMTFAERCTASTVEWNFSGLPVITQVEQINIQGIYEKGYTMKEVAASRKKSPRTVINQVVSVYDKLGIRDVSDRVCTHETLCLGALLQVGVMTIAPRIDQTKTEIYQRGIQSL